MQIRSILLSFIVFLFFYQATPAQNWKWWMGDINDQNIGSASLMATNSQGELFAFFNSDSISTSSNIDFVVKAAQNNIIQISPNGTLRKATPIMGRTVLQLHCNHKDELIALVERIDTITATQYLIKFNQDLNVIDSVDLISYFPFGGSISQVNVADFAFSADSIAFAMKVYGKYMINSVQNTVTEGTFHGLVEDRKAELEIDFTRIETHSADFATIVQPELAFMQNDVVMYNNARRGTTRYLYRYLLNKAVDSVLLPSGVSQVSICNLPGMPNLYMFMGVNGKVEFAGKTLNDSGAAHIILKFKNTSFSDFDTMRLPERELFTGLEGVTYSRFLSGSKDKLFYAYETNFINAKSVGVVEVEADFSSSKTHSFSSTIKNISDPFFRPMVCQIMPHNNGFYQLLPNTNWDITFGPRISFLSASELDATPAKLYDLLIAFGKENASLDVETNCDGTTLTIDADISEIDSIIWDFDGRPSQKSMPSLKLKSSDNYKGEICANVYFSNGSSKQLCEQVVPVIVPVPNIDSFQNPICQFSEITFSSRTDFGNSVERNETWEFWKNDTVFFSSISGTPTLKFTEAGVFSIKYYAENEFCKKNLLLTDTLEVKPAEEAKILEFPWPVCQNLVIHPKTKKGDSSAQFEWSNGVVGPSTSFDSAGIAWVKYELTSENGCSNIDSIAFNVLPSGGPVVNYVETNNNLTPFIHFDTASFYAKYQFESDSADRVRTIYSNKTFRDGGANLEKFIPQYRIEGIDRCGQKTKEEWRPVRLGFNNYIELLEWNSPNNHRKLDTIKITDLSTKQTESRASTSTQLDINDLQHHRFQVFSYNSNGKLIAISNEFGQDLLAEITMPNAFTPNGDGLNDVFLGYLPPDNVLIKAEILARNGQKVNVSNDLLNIWDGNVNGEMAPVGQYEYILTLLDANGEEKVHSGFVMLIR